MFVTREVKQKPKWGALFGTPYDVKNSQDHDEHGENSVFLDDLIFP